jgi:hypothetical protein
MEKINQTVLDRVTQSWLKASSQLGVKVVAPYSVTEGNESLKCLAFLRDFGGPHGMVVAALVPPKFETNTRLLKAARKMAFYCTSINPLGWVEYDEYQFKELLEDCGYYGPGSQCPSWFNGYKHFSDT